MRVLAMASQKGGSGKTTLSGHLAVQAQLAGAGPVGLIDIDPQGSLADWWNEREADMPAFAQTTVARLAADLEVLRQQGFRLAVVDTPPAITMAIQSVIAVAELIVISNSAEPARSAGGRRHGRPLRPRRKAADFRPQCGDPQSQDHLRSRRRAVTARHRCSCHRSPPHRFRRFDDRRPNGDGDRSERTFGQGNHRALGIYFGSSRKEFPQDCVRGARSDGGRRSCKSASRRRLRPPCRRPIRSRRSE